MIAELIDVLNVAAGTLPVDTRHGWAQIVAGQPAVHTGGGQWVPVANDLNGTWSYIRINGQARVEPTDIGEPCSGVRVRLPFRLVALLNRSECAELPGLLVQTAGSIRQARRQFVTASGAYQVVLSNILWQIDDFVNQEFQPTPIVPSDRVLVALDIIMEVDGREDCFEVCGELTDVVCAIITKASNAKVVECLGPDRVAEICDSTPCPPCDPLTITVNGELALEVPDPCGEDVGLLIIDREGDEVAVTINRGSIVVDALPCDPCEPCPLGYSLQDSAENILLAGIINDPCEDPTLLITAPDGSVQLRDTDGNTLGGLVDVRSGQTGFGVTAPDGTVTRDGLPFGSVLSGGTLDVPSNCPTLCALLGAVLPANAQSEILDCVTTGTQDAIREILTDRDIVATWGAYENETNAVVLPAAFQGRTYDFLSSTGTNGTITVSVNGGTSFAAPPFTVGTGGLIFRRTTITAAGTATYRE
jgi:hypothetical protein